MWRQIKMDVYIVIIASWSSNSNYYYLNVICIKYVLAIDSVNIICNHVMFEMYKLPDENSIT